MFKKKLEEVKLGLTFDDVLLPPARTKIEPNEVSLEVKLTKNINLNIPILSSPMDTVTEADMAIALARLGGLGVIHRNLPMEDQLDMVKKVKREESLKIKDLVTVSPNMPVNETLKIMEKHKIAGLPVVDGGVLIGILTNRDLRFYNNVKIPNIKVKDLMSKNVIMADEDITIEEAREILHKNRIEKLPLINKKKELVGLITVKDILKREKYPTASRDEEGRLLVGAAIGPFDMERAKNLEDAGADAIVVDTAHAHNENVMNSIKKIRKEIDIDIIAGNIATKEAAEDLISLNVDALRVGIGPGSICTTRVIAGVGVPQLTAVAETAEAAESHGISVIADGGIRYSGDVVKVMAAGAKAVMLGGMFAGTKEAPGREMIIDGRKYKLYRGMGSIGAIRKGMSDRYGQIGATKFSPEGVEAVVAFKGNVSEVIYQLMGGIKSGMGYVGVSNINELRRKAEFVRITNSGLKESHPHDVKIISETPNYPL